MRKQVIFTLSPFKHGIRVRYRVDGILQEVMTLPRKMLHPLVSRIKVMANMDIAERQVPQDGRVPLKAAGAGAGLEDLHHTHNFWGKSVYPGPV